MVWNKEEPAVWFAGAYAVCQFPVLNVWAGLLSVGCPYVSAWSGLGAPCLCALSPEHWPC